MGEGAAGLPKGEVTEHAGAPDVGMTGRQLSGGLQVSEARAHLLVLLAEPETAGEEQVCHVRVRRPFSPGRPSHCRLHTPVTLLRAPALPHPLRLPVSVLGNSRAGRVSGDWKLR